MDVGFNEPSVTLIIKAPNQKIADHEVECLLDWTVRKLKEHLAIVYPNKPQEDQQRIIYSGQLLTDNQKLRDVLSQSSFMKSKTHVMHLVWSPPKQEMEQCQSEGHSADSGETTLRHRRTAPASLDVHNVEATNQSPPVPATAIPLSMSQPSFTATPPSLPSPMSAAYSSEQMAWMHHLYAQQWAQYMQYMQLYQPAQHMGTFTPPPIVNQAHIVPPAYINEPAAQIPAAAAAQPAPRLPGNDVARGGVVQNQMGPIMDDEEEEGGRDWLDHVYAVCRFILLFAMIYFYSSLDRFILVVTLFISVYMFHVGWLQMRRRAPPVDNNRQQQRAAPPPPAEGGALRAEQRPQADNSNQNGNQDNQASSEPTAPSPDTVAAPRASYGAICWQFVSSFFTSLIPHQWARL